MPRLQEAQVRLPSVSLHLKTSVPVHCLRRLLFAIKSSCLNQKMGALMGDERRAVAPDSAHLSATCTENAVTPLCRTERLWSRFSQKKKWIPC